MAECAAGDTGEGMVSEARGSTSAVCEGALVERPEPESGRVGKCSRGYPSPPNGAS